MPPNDEPPLSLSARIMKLQGHTVYVDRWTGLEEAIAAGSGYGHVYISGDSLPPTPDEPYRPVCGMSQDANSSPPVADWIRTADGRFFRRDQYPQLVARYAGHDVTDQPRDDHGRWANAGREGNAKQLDKFETSVRIADRATSEKPANRPSVLVPDDGNSGSANTDRLRAVLERFKALHPHQFEYTEPIQLVEEQPNWENFDRPIRWDGSTLRVRTGTSDFDVLHRLARSISQDKGYKKWLKNQIESGEIEVPREHGELWSNDAVGAALRHKRNQGQWYEYMEAAGATPAEISSVKQAQALNDWFGPGGYV